MLLASLPNSSTASVFRGPLFALWVALSVATSASSGLAGDSASIPLPGSSTTPVAGAKELQSDPQAISISQMIQKIIESRENDPEYIPKIKAEAIKLASKCREGGPKEMRQACQLLMLVGEYDEAMKHLKIIHGMLENEKDLSLSDKEDELSISLQLLSEMLCFGCTADLRKEDIPKAVSLLTDGMLVSYPQHEPPGQPTSLRHRRNPNAFPPTNRYFDEERLKILESTSQRIQEVDGIPLLVKELEKQANTIEGWQKIYPLLARAYLNWWFQDKNKATEQIREIVATRDNEELRVTLAEMYIIQEKYAEALAQLDTIAVQNGPIFVAKQQGIVRAARLADKPDLARQAALRLAALELPSDERVSLIEDLRKLGLKDKAEELNAQAMRSTNPNGSTSDNTAESIHLQNDPVDTRLAMEWVSSDLAGKYTIKPLQTSLELQPKKPADLKKAPSDLIAPLYGRLVLGPRESPTVFLVILDGATGGTRRCFIDANSNGDLTDDPPVDAIWESDNGTAGNYTADLDLPISYGTSRRAGRLHITFYDTPADGKDNSHLYVNADFGLAGRISLGDKTFTAVLMDSSVTGDFRLRDQNVATLWIDTNHDGLCQSEEWFETDKPFNIGGITWELIGLNAEGDFTIVKSTQTVAERPVPAPSSRVDSKGPDFTATTVDGKRVNFPADYKGKLVLVDFWATWCGPCMHEMPNVAKQYAALHDRGLEILGVSLDSAADDHFAKVLKKQNMVWPQVCDGKNWEGSLVKLFSVETIPHCILFDGTTGKILAENIRGDALPLAIEAGLKKMKSAGAGVSSKVAPQQNPGTTPR